MLAMLQSVATVWQQSCREMRPGQLGNPAKWDVPDAGGPMFAGRVRFRSVWMQVRRGSSPLIRIAQRPTDWVFLLSCSPPAMRYQTVRGNCLATAAVPTARSPFSAVPCLFYMSVMTAGCARRPRSCHDAASRGRDSARRGLLRGGVIASSAA